MPKLESLLEFVASQPDDPLPRYALAMEYRNLGRAVEAAQTFLEIVAKWPAYVPSYLMAAQTLIGIGRKDEARQVIERGIEAARTARDAHAASELQDALDGLG